MKNVKEKLFGATIVAALSIIFVPMLLMGNDDQKLNLAQFIPNKPDLKPAEQLASKPVINTFKHQKIVNANKPKVVISSVAPTKVASKPVVAKATQTKISDKKAVISTQSSPKPKLTNLVDDAHFYASLEHEHEHNFNPQKAESVKSKAAVASSTVPQITSKPLVAEASEVKISEKKVASAQPNSQAEFVPSTSSKLNSKSSLQPIAASNSKVNLKPSLQPITAKQAHEAWVVRLATFGNSRNAEKLAVQLKQDGYDAYTQASKRSDQNYTFVMVGPSAERQTAQKLTNDLQSKYKLKGLVVEQQPNTRG